MHLFHEWQIIKNTRWAKYRLCKKCGKRDVEQSMFGQWRRPADPRWVLEGKFTEFMPNKSIVDKGLTLEDY
jgi:hypothetical protein